ncbi:serine/threonine-protein phosphatase 7 long form homolog [Salvia splendens]|uniref:serine/threonine-protein phosphatase 7 long form homolog n=1 Tax=Salvia splendens TaxID=180675 RepID=UPI001C26D3D8|nr:serine/threonine-protein phosphatase 7 long form homolog [Salvia splendens]
MKVDNELITALIERWRPETHTFHLPIGETTITLEDVQAIWGLRADGLVFTGRDYHDNFPDWTSKCRDLLGWIPDSSTETKQDGLLMTALINQTRMPLGDDLPTYVYIQRARIHALVLLGGLILPDTTGCKVPFMWLNGLGDPEEVKNISWGSAALAYLYHYLCEASMDKRKELGGPMILLQLWAWERMPTLRPAFIGPVVHEPYTPCGARWKGTTQIGNAPRYSVEHYRDQISLIRPSQFIWTPYAHCILSDYCNDVNGCSLCETYLVCWAYVEAHEPGKVRRQFNRYQDIPHYVDRMLRNADHLGKNDRRGRKGNNWANTHQFYIGEWDMRYERFQAAEYAVPMSMNIPMNPGYMAWYNRITVTYMTQPGTRATGGMNESAASMRLFVEGFQQVFHLTTKDEMDPRVRQIREIVKNVLESTNNADVMEYPASQHQDVVMPYEPEVVPRRRGVPGVRTGGHGYTKQFRMSQPLPDYAAPEPQYQEPDPPQWYAYPEHESQSQWERPQYSPSQPEPDWTRRPYSQSQDVQQWSGARASVDSFFQNYQIVPPVQSAEEGDAGEEETGNIEEENEEEQSIHVDPRPSMEGSSRGGVGKLMSKVYKRLSTRKNKGTGPSKYTPSSYK